jgi:hypothetical protein
MVNPMALRGTARSTLDRAVNSYPLTIAWLLAVRRVLLHVAMDARIRESVLVQVLLRLGVMTASVAENLRQTSTAKLCRSRTSIPARRVAGDVHWVAEKLGQVVGVEQRASYIAVDFCQMAGHRPA